MKKVIKWGLIVCGVLFLLALISPKSEKTTVTILDKQEIASSEATIAKNEPIILTGTSKQATKLFVLNEGLRRFTLKYTGSSNFIVKLLDENGNPAGGSFGLDSLLVNEIGNFEGSKAVRIDKTGSYLLDITGTGKWIITIE